MRGRLIHSERLLGGGLVGVHTGGVLRVITQTSPYSIFCPVLVLWFFFGILYFYFL